MSLFSLLNPLNLIESFFILRGGDGGKGGGGNRVSGTITPRGIETSAVSTLTSSTGITVNTTGDSVTNANLPPYYALAFIQRVS